MPGRQFANDSMTPEPISVSRDKYKDEIPSDRTNHENSTPEHSNPSYTGRQFSDDWDGGFKPYGVNVGKSADATEVGIKGDVADRGRES